MSTRRPHITWKTKYAAALALWGGIPYADAKQMTEEQIISLFHIDHSIYFESGHADRNKFWNLAPMLIREHRTKTKLDAKIIAKGRHIRRKEHLIEINREMREFARENPDRALAEAFIEGTHDGRQRANESWSKEASRPGGALQWSERNRLRSRGFDKTHVRHFDGTVSRRRKPYGKKAR